MEESKTMTVNELRAMRAKAWESAKDFLDSHRGETGILSEEDTRTYEEMEAKIVNLGREIERQEKMDAMEREMAISRPPRAHTRQQHLREIRKVFCGWTQELAVLQVRRLSRRLLLLLFFGGDCKGLRHKP